MLCFWGGGGVGGRKESVGLLCLVLVYEFIYLYQYLQVELNGVPSGVLNTFGWWVSSRDPEPSHHLF